jgi:hypothetical protein
MATGDVAVAGTSRTVKAFNTGPPASPTTDDLWIATAAGANGENWMFVYDGASASAHKWEFIGGPWVQLQDDSDVLTGSTSMVTLGAMGSMSPARNGDYELMFGANAYTDSVGAYAYTSLHVGGVNIGNIYHGTAIANVWQGGSFRITRHNGYTTGNAYDLRHQVSSGTGHWTHRGLAIRPVRVS